MDWESQASLNIALTGSIFSGLPFTQSKPAGLFIHAFAATTKIPDSTPEIPTTTPDAQCTHLFKRSQPYKKTPRAIASTKKAVPSQEKGIPMMAPACFIKLGQSRPSSNES